MSIAQKIHARGKAEGLAIGRAEGQAIARAEGLAIGKAKGKMQLLQSLMGLPVSPDAELAGLSVPEIESRFTELEHRYKTEFRRP